MKSRADAHNWYGDVSSWTEEQLERYHRGRGLPWAQEESPPTYDADWPPWHHDS